MQYITITPSATAVVTLEGYRFNKLDYVAVSAADTSIFPYLCSYRFFTAPHRGTTRFITISGYPYANYLITSKNTLKLYLTAADTPGVYDIFFGNTAGYAKLSDKGYLIMSQ